MIILGLAFRDTGPGCGVFVFIAFGLAIFGFLMWAGSLRNKSRADVLASLATRWNGTVEPGGFLANPHLTIHSDGIPGTVTFFTGGRSERPWTKIQFGWPAPQRLRVVPESFASWIRRAFGTDDLKLGEEGFDSAFWIETSASAWAREVLSKEVRRGIGKLQAEYSGWGNRGIFTLDIGPAGVTVRFTRVLVDKRESLERFIELAILILQQARGSGAVAGVVVLAVQTGAGSPCPVCGHAVESSKTCPQCRTPHHQECWTYMGGCAIFACAGRAVQARRVS